MARTDMVAARIWYQRPAAITVCCMGFCSGKEIACRTPAETCRVELLGVLSLMTAVGTKFDRRQ
jgi:hypothetical protein